ncbi:hypothetical protein ROV96_19045 [Stenotrophomonas pavanii]|uniref:hypothetical protein n=1 Tax=Stenotrophomonas pavanii TaxID=487698 RepID=UPI002894268C|nr:hypothetical protein [Stenotrophomonas pavanii]MDT3457453.1 hypothetical protein [Stenotrophomonas pavanii]MDT3466035.1 hypothetical protein [Stenotrophomonas pavanii]
MFSWFKPKAVPPQPVNPGPSLDGVSWYDDILTKVESFWVVNPIEPSQRSSFLLSYLHSAIEAGDKDRVYLALEVALQSEGTEKAACLCEMLLVREHDRHQELVRELQLMAEPSAVPYLVQAFNSNLDHMVEYNGSGSGVVAKWFSHAFFDIGTPEAIEAIKTLSAHSDTEVRDEMAYRLAKLEGSN